MGAASTDWFEWPFVGGVTKSEQVESEPSFDVEDVDVPEVTDVPEVVSGMDVTDEDVDVTSGVPSCVVEDKKSRVVEDEVSQSGVLQSGAPTCAVEDESRAVKDEDVDVTDEAVDVTSGVPSCVVED